MFEGNLQRSEAPGVIVWGRRVFVLGALSNGWRDGTLKPLATYREGEAYFVEAR